MPDLYLLLTPFFAFFSLLTLINLKLALAEPKHQDLPKYQSKNLSNQDNVKQETNGPKYHDESAYFNTLKYLLKNFTIFEHCMVRRSTNKIPLFFSISAMAISTLFIKTKVIFVQSCFGFLTTLFYILLKMIDSSRDQEKSNILKEEIKKSKVQIEQKNGQKLEIILTSISLLTNLTIIWLLYKNTNNSEILSSIYNFLIIFSLDNFLVKPLMLSLAAFPLKFWSFVHFFIDKETQIMQILRGQRVLKRQGKHKKRVFTMNRVHNTTSNTENTIEIQPCVNYDLHGNNIMSSKIDDKDASKCSFTYKKSEGKMQQSESSLVKYINYPFKNIQPNTVGSKVCNLRKVELDEKIIIESTFSKKDPIETSSIKRKRNKLYNQKIGLIPEFIYDESGLPKNVQNQQEADPHIQTEFNPASYLSAKRSSTSRHNESHKKQSENKANRLSIERNTLYHSNQRPNLITQPQIFNNSCVSGFNYTAKTDLLKIREDKHGQDVEQIDMNSPERYKNHLRKLHVKAGQQRKMSMNQNDEHLKIGVTKSFKKYSLDPNNQILQKVIQNRNHQLNSIEKQQRNDLDGSNRRKTLNRTSQMNLSRKSDVFARFSNDSRMAKSVKRTKNNKDPIVRQNDENRIPEFVIQDFTC